MSKTQNKWELIDWDGNLSLGFKCYRKKFGKGHVSVGCGDFLTIVYSFGPNSDYSMSSTRWRKDHILSEQDAMNHVDATIRKHLSS